MIVNVNRVSPGKVGVASSGENDDSAEFRTAVIVKGCGLL